MNGDPMRTKSYPLTALFMLLLLPATACTDEGTIYDTLNSSNNLNNTNNTTCLLGAPGESCSGNETCCSGICRQYNSREWRCSYESLCLAAEVACGDASECCSYSCNGGFCALEGDTCRPSGEQCTLASECCSEMCIENSEGVSLCEPVSGCAPAGELCFQDEDCCSGLDGEENACLPIAGGDGAGRCATPEECGGAGEMCGFSELPCCGGEPSFQQVTTNVWRCTLPNECSAVQEQCQENNDCCSGLCEGEVCQEVLCLPAGVTCAFSEQCCSNICTPETAESPFVCQTACVDSSNPCSIDSDCCSNTCNSFTHTCTP